MSERRAPPGDLAARGRGRVFWQAVVELYELSVAELELLAEVCRILDQLDALRTELDRAGLTVTGSTGQSRPNGLLVEIRGSRALLGKLLAQLHLPDEVGEVILSPASARGRHAAWSRWHGARSGRPGAGARVVSRRRELHGGETAGA